MIFGSFIILDHGGLLLHFVQAFASITVTEVTSTRSYIISISIDIESIDIESKKPDKMSISLYMMFARGLKRLFVTKSAAAFASDETIGEDHLERNMSLFDLLCIGVGGTLGSGVFVLSGFVVSQYSGPSAFLSVLIAGSVCLFSAASYGELASRIPAAGSTYAYAYYALGEYPAVLAAWALSLEYGVSAAAVARSWGSKVAYYISSYNVPIVLPADDTPSSSNNYGINYFAGLISFVCVCILLAGKDVGKTTVNTITVFKICLVIFMIITGFAIYQSSNLVPFAPFGISGILAGATQSFFGFVGFDEVCCLAAEVKDPHRSLPIAVFGTIVIVTVLSSLASLALAGADSYTDISPTDGFSDAFSNRGLFWASQIVSIGEIISLPLVVLVSFLAQPRLQYALARDNLMPKIFGELNSKGNLTKSILISGVVVILISLFIPFNYLNSMISAGVLCSFNLSNSAIIMVRRGRITSGGLEMASWHPCSWYLIAYHSVALIVAFFIAALITDSNSTASIVVVVILLVIELCLSLTIFYRCPENPDPDAEGQYRVAWMPFFPLIGILINYILIAQLVPTGLILIVSYFVAATIYYFVYCVGRKSAMEIDNDNEKETRLLQNERESMSELPLLEINNNVSDRVSTGKEENEEEEEDNGSVQVTSGRKEVEGEKEEEENDIAVDNTTSNIEFNPGKESDEWQRELE